LTHTVYILKTYPHTKNEVSTSMLSKDAAQTVQTHRQMTVNVITTATFMADNETKAWFRSLLCYLDGTGLAHSTAQEFSQLVTLECQYSASTSLLP